MNDQASAPQSIPITVNVLQGLLEYLDTRPHREVRMLIDAIQVQVQQFQKEQPVADMNAPADARPLPN
jgi:hypothetical protein